MNSCAQRRRKTNSTFIVTAPALAIFFCVLTMVGSGSWANTQKLAGKDNWPFELYYWDYAVGVFLVSVLMLFTLGQAGTAGVPELSNLREAGWPAIGKPYLAAFYSMCPIWLFLPNASKR